MQRRTRWSENENPSNNLRNMLSVMPLLILSEGLDINPNNLWAQNVTAGRKKAVFVMKE